MTKPQPSREDSQPDLDLHALLESRRVIGVLWGISDVRFVRPDLSDDQCWEVLRFVRDRLDATAGTYWEVLETAVARLLGDDAGPDGGAAGEP
ncbi:MAG TPA: hypothetical protein VH092_23785 [Urbifossiella sp.]|jgi:hypothetical protein|nr:hypothetical protein [Urbifossiella sp.]